MDIVISLASPADAPDMAEVLSRSWEAAYRDIIPMSYIKEKNATRAALFKRIITDENDSQYVIRSDGKIVGIMCAAPPQENDAPVVNDGGIDDSFYELHGLYLHPDAYRRGIGTAAMSFAFDKARGVGKTNMILWVFAENLNAIKFYQNFGFIMDGASKIYSCGKNINSLRMKKIIALT